MKNIENQDERVLAQRRKIQSDGFQLLIYGLLISIVIQQFFLQAPPSQYIGELLCLIGAGLYHVFNLLNLGDSFYCDDNYSGKRLFKNALFSGVGTVFVVIFLMGERDINSILSYVSIYTIGFGGMTYLIYYIARKKKSRIEKEMDDDEDDIE